MSKVAFMKNSDLKGCLSLLQVWAWERLHLKPRLCVNLQLDGQIPLGCRWNVQKCFDETPARQLDFYRNELDRMKIFQMEWEPYTPFLDHLPPICTEYPVIWRARVHLICFEIVEMHVPDRVLRQFDLAQHVHPISRSSTPYMHRIPSYMESQSSSNMFRDSRNACTRPRASTI
ncbi:serine/threonine-protein phosphatase 7 long form homolog [Asparagus officinalis]|uniref:serine/threonine-protein phosphatase 7 long form homolog n=1 Tax=Asparagus officinalis TaxID=4686 RepID=UPI00098E8095|nr:serine/threonine-protein phosphatase 7 long form homolog [Asparagus officinalis]